MPSLKSKLLEPYLGLKLWILIGICCGTVTVLILCLLSIWILFKKKSKNRYSISQIPTESKDIKVDMVGKNSELVHLSEPDNLSQCSSVYHHEKSSQSGGEDGGSGTFLKNSLSPYNGGLLSASPLVGLPEVSHLGWGHWFTLRDLEVATNRFSADKVLGEGGYGVVYRGRLINGTNVAVKKLLNNLGQAEKEFRVEVEAIGHVRHKNLVRLLGFCIEGVHRHGSRMLVYEYVNNGNLEQWLHGAMREYGTLSWAARMKVVLGTAKALAYLHEGIEPKVVHRDIKSSNILIDQDFNAKVSDFGLAKLLGSGESHITTRVMGTLGYVAPEYANSGLLNEKSDIYSFGVVLLEAITGRDPVDYRRPDNEVHLVEWLKMMVNSRRVEDVIDPNIEPKPSTRALKRALLVALRCVDLEADKRPKMTHVVRMLDTDEYPYQESLDRRNRKNPNNVEIDSLKESPRHGYLRSKSEAHGHKLWRTDEYN